MSEGRDPKSASEAAPAQAVPEGSSAGGARHVRVSEQRTVISKRRPSAAAALARSVKPQEIGESLVGQQLGHFQLEEFIGGGGMGAVFRAVDTSLGRTVAVKVVPSEHADEETLRRFRNEAQSAARLDHPNIARVYFVGEDKGWNYIVFEYIEGVNIRDLVEHKGPLSVEEAISYTLQVAEALDHAAQRDVVHRDIKPSNILVMPDGRAKLVDMGLARLHHVDSPANDLTATGVTLGTFDYISPEQARDPRSADVRSDLYSLGCTLYYMLTGMPPFPEGTVLQKLLSHSSDQPPDARELRPDLSDEFAGLVLKLMAKQPSGRPTSPRALINDLELVAEHLGLVGLARGGAARLTTGQTWWGRVESHLPWAIPLVTLVAAVFVLEGIWRSQDQAAGPPGKPALVNQPQAEPVRAAPDRTPPASATETPPGNGAEAPGGPAAAASEPAVSAPVAEAGNGREPPAAAPAESAPAAPADGTPPPRPPEPLAPGLAGSGSNGDADRPAATGQAPPDAPAAVPAPPDRLFVGTPAEGDAAGTVFATLQAALQAAAELPTVKTVEVRSDLLAETAFKVNLPREELVVRAAKDARPLIVFYPPTSEIALEKPMIKLVGGQIEFQNLHFRVDLADGPVEGCELFRLHEVDKISLTDCSLTFRSEYGGTASFFAVQGPRDTMVGTQDETPRVNYPAKIELTRCLLRGRATGVRAVEGLPFRLTWNQGLFSSSQRLFEVEGLKRTSGTPTVRVHLGYVTASMRQGLGLVKLRDSKPVTPFLDLSYEYCVIKHDRNRPLIEMDGVETVAKAEDALEIEGGHNYYDETDVLLRIQPVSDDLTEFRWEDRDRAALNWLGERASSRYVRWDEAAVEGRSDREYEHTRSDFLLDKIDRDQAGFDARQIPQPPGASPPPPMPAVGDTDLSGAVLDDL